MVVGLGVGLPLNLACTLLRSPALFFVDRYVFPPVVALGYLGLIGTLVDRTGGTDWLSTRLALIGRTALSCYMLQNMLAMVPCPGWGFGLAGKITEHRPLWTIAAWFGIGGALMAFSTLWLRYFEQGPVETVWRWAYEAPRRRVDTRTVST